MGQKSKRLTINLIAQLVSFAVSLGIGFFLTPYVTDKLGKEVYGFVGMAYQVTTYILVFTVAFNSMLNIFVATEYHKNNIKKASSFYTSVLVIDNIIAIVLVLPIALMVFFMDKVLDVPASSLNDIKFLWGFIFLSFLIQLMTGPFACGYFVTNRYDTYSKRGIISNLVKGGILLATFTVLVPKVWYVGCAAFVSVCYMTISNFYDKQKLLPEVKFDIKLFSMNSVKELVLVGMWNTVYQLTYILNSGLDLLISNVFISSLAMGYISYAQTFPTQISNLTATISSTFTPSMTESYAKDSIDDFEKNLKSAIKICGFISSIPVLGFVAFGQDFYSLWIPALSHEDIVSINYLSWMILIPTYLMIYTKPMNEVQSITKKIKIPAMVSFGTAITNFALEITLLKLTNLGVYSIEIATAIVIGVQILLFTPVYTARNIKKEWYIFYPTLIRCFLSSFVVLVVFFLIRQVVTINSWFDLIIIAIPTGLLGYCISAYTLLSKSERQMVIGKIKAKIGR